MSVDIQSFMEKFIAHEYIWYGKYILFFKIFFVYFKKGTGLHLFVV